MALPAASPEIRRGAIEVDPLLIARAYKLAQGAEFVVKMGNPGAVDLAAAGLMKNSPPALSALHSYRTSETMHPASDQARLNTLLILLRASRARMMQLGFDVNPGIGQRLIDVGLIFGVQRDTQGSRKGRLPNTGEGYFDLVYVSAPVLDGVALQIDELHNRHNPKYEVPEELVKPIASDIIFSITDLAVARRNMISKGFVPPEIEIPEIRPLNLDSVAAKEVGRYARLQRQAQMYANRAL